MCVVGAELMCRCPEGERWCSTRSGEGGDLPAPELHTRASLLSEILPLNASSHSTLTDTNEANFEDVAVFIEVFSSLQVFSNFLG